MLVPENILLDFDIADNYDFKEYWLIELNEKLEKKPIELQNEEEIVFDGYCNPLEMFSHSFML